MTPFSNVVKFYIGDCKAKSSSTAQLISLEKFSYDEMFINMKRLFQANPYFSTFSLEKSLQGAFVSRQEIQRDYLELEARAKEMELKAFFRLRDQERIKILCTEQQLEQVRAFTLNWHSCVCRQGLTSGWFKLIVYEDPFCGEINMKLHIQG